MLLVDSVELRILAGFPAENHSKRGSGANIRSIARTWPAPYPRTKLRNTLVGEWGFPEDCAEDVIEHGIRLATSDGDRRGILRRGE